MEQSTDREWLAWVSIQRRIAAREAAGQPEEALEEIDRFLGTRPKPDLASDALALCGSIRRNKGELNLAKSDLQSARYMTPEASYARYTIELSLGALCEEQELPEEAVSRYLRALGTASKDPGTSGGPALGRLLEITDFRSLSEDQKALCLQVVRQAWDLFRLPGEPDLTNLKRTVRTLSEASSRRKTEDQDG